MLKFKLWDKEDQKWYKPTYEAYRGDLEDIHLSMGGQLLRRTMTEFEHESMFPQRYEIVCSTWELDSEGKEIYWGDICNVELISGKKYTHVIDYSKAAFTFGEHTLHNVLKDVEKQLATIKVVGNKFEDGNLPE